jgi:hypothetical protein
MPDLSHTNRAVGSRIGSDSAGHLDHAWPGNGRATSQQIAELSASEKTYGLA